MTYSNLVGALRTTALGGVSNRMKTRLEAEDLSTFPGYEPIISSFFTLVVQYNEALGREQTLSELEEADDIRDEAFRNLHSLIKGYLAVPSLAPVAQPAFAILNKRGLSVTSLAYDDETGAIDSIIEELDKLALPALMYAETMLEALRTAENNFKTKANAYDDSKNKKPSASALKKELVNYINNRIVSYHNALAETNGEAFKKMADAIDKMIVDENTLTRSRQNRPGNSETKD
ncbi:MAG: DUF6261 family protein [Mangrovibacterium sp.]